MEKEEAKFCLAVLEAVPDTNLGRTTEIGLSQNTSSQSRSTVWKPTDFGGVCKPKHSDKKLENKKHS
jgi:hypothetical protein